LIEWISCINNDYYMKDKNLPLDNNVSSLEELTDQANKIIESLENEKDLNNSVESYQELLKLNKNIEKKFHKNFKNIGEETNKKVKEIIKKNDK
jgi:exonuclease VII small subunit